MDDSDYIHNVNKIDYSGHLIIHYPGVDALTNLSVMSILRRLIPKKHCRAREARGIYPGVRHHEANLSAQQDPAGPQIRIQGPHEDGQRPSHSQAPPCQGPHQAEHLRRRQKVLIRCRSLMDPLQVSDSASTNASVCDGTYQRFSIQAPAAPSRACAFTTSPPAPASPGLSS